MLDRGISMCSIPPRKFRTDIIPIKVGLTRVFERVPKSKMERFIINTFCRLLNVVTFTGDRLNGRNTRIKRVGNDRGRVFDTVDANKDFP